MSNVKNINEINVNKLIKQNEEAKVGISDIAMKIAFERAEKKGTALTNIGAVKMGEPECVTISPVSNEANVELEATAQVYFLIKSDVKVKLSEKYIINPLDDTLMKFEAGKYTGLTESTKIAIQEDLLGRAVKELSDKVKTLNEDTQKKMGKTAEKIINENKGGVICILL